MSSQRYVFVGILLMIPALLGAGAAVGGPAAIEINIFRIVGGGGVPSVAWVYSGPSNGPMGFNVNGPATIEVPLNTVVTWRNQDVSTRHSVTNGLAPDTSLPSTVTSLIDDEVKLSSFGSPSLGAGDAFSWTFSEPGIYPYYCNVGGLAGHHLNGMRGVIEVVAP